MRKHELIIGATYAMLVSGKIVPVRLGSPHPLGGWVGENRLTNREVRVRSAQRCRYEMECTPSGQWRPKDVEMARAHKQKWGW